MIYVSSACSREKKIGDAVAELAEYGFRYIELTGGTFFYEGYEEDILRLREKYKLTYLIHNYFPPPRKDFVLNLASLDDDIFQESIGLLKKSVQLSKKIGATKFGFHAGFMVDVPVSKLGGTFSTMNISAKSEAIQRFCQGYKAIQEDAAGVQLYLENHVFNAENYTIYGDAPPLMLLTYEDYIGLKQHIPFHLLLDIGHLKVTTRTLNLDFEKEFQELFVIADYIHISDNDGTGDQNKALSLESDLYALFASQVWKGKTISLEIYEGLPSVRRTVELLLPLFS